MIDSLLQDVRRAARLLRASPGLLIVSVLSLGLGLGVNLTLFTAVRAVFFHMPSIADPGRVVGVEPGNSNQYLYLNYRDLVQSNIFESVAGFRRVQLNLRGREQVERVDGLAVTANFFDMLGVGTAVGRPFTAEEAAAEGQPRVAVLSHRFWLRRFNGDPRVIGERLTLNNASFDVLGVLPASYRPVTPTEDPDIYVPLSALVLPTIDNRSNGNALGVLGRLSPGRTRAQAQAAVTTLGQQLEQGYPLDNNGMGRPAKVVPLQIREFGSWQEPLVISGMLLTLFGLVLLSACANVAGLLLARVARQQREIAVRLALGARRGRLIRMLLAESFGLACLGAVSGGILFVWLTRVLRSISLPGGLGAVNLSMDVDATVSFYALVLVVATGLLCGIVPAWRATRGSVVSDIQSGDSYGATGRLRMRHAFVIGQMASSVTLLVVSALLVRSLVRVTALDPGFDLDCGLVASVNVEADRYAVDGGLPLGERIVDALKGMPGVESSSFAGIVALGTDQSSTRLQVEGVAPGTVGARTFINSVGPAYFATLAFASSPDASSIRAIARGRRRWRSSATRSPVPTSQGRTRLASGSGARKLNLYAEIVGIVADSKYGSVAEAATPLYYSAYTQRPQVLAGQAAGRSRSLGRAAHGVAQRGQARDHGARACGIHRHSHAARRNELGSRTTAPWTRLFGVLGLVALLLATIGLYGMMAFVVSSRTREIGTGWRWARRRAGFFEMFLRRDCASWRSAS